MGAPNSTNWKKLAKTEPVIILKDHGFVLPNGKETTVGVRGNAYVQFDKVYKYARGKSITFTQEMEAELNALRQLRHKDQTGFGANVDKAFRLKKLQDLKRNYQRSIAMGETLRKAGFKDTEDANNTIISHLLDVGQHINVSNNVKYESILRGPNGNVKVLSTWKVLPDGRVYLSSIVLIPID